MSKLRADITWNHHINSRSLTVTPISIINDNIEEDDSYMSDHEDENNNEDDDKIKMKMKMKIKIMKMMMKMMMRKKKIVI